MIDSIFQGLDMNEDGLISKSEFIVSATQDSNVTTLLCKAAEKEKIKQEIEKSKNSEENDSNENLTEKSKSKKKKKRTKSKDKLVLEKYIASHRKMSDSPTFTRMSRRRSVF